MSTSVIRLPAWIYRQSAVVPFRTGSDGLEVLLVTSRRGSHWVLPKGVVDPGLTASESAAKEAREEAGVEGIVGARSLGKYRYEKWGGTCKVEVFPMEVTAEADVWPESQTRQREWMTLAEATKRLGKKGLRKVVRRLPEAVEALRAAGPGEVPPPGCRSALKGKPSRLIYLLRHAKSSRAEPDLRDFERPLAPRGERAIEKMREYIAFADLKPELVLCSSSIRTRQTLAGILPALGEEVPVKFDRRIYMLGTRGLLNRLRQVPDSVASVMLIAHNPGLQSLALDLVGGNEDEAQKQMREKFPTAALATLVWQGRKWAEVGPGTCQLHSFVVPRQP